MFSTGHDAANRAAVTEAVVETAYSSFSRTDRPAVSVAVRTASISARCSCRSSAAMHRGTTSDLVSPALRARRSRSSFSSGVI